MTIREPENGPRDPSRPLDDEEWERIAEYVAGRSTPDERAVFEARLAGDAVLRAHVDRARYVWERSARALDRPVTAAEVERAWQRLAAEVAAPRAPIVLPRRRERAPLWRAAAVAATVVLGLGAGATWLAVRPEPPVALREFAAARGQRLAVSLGEGSRVVLAPGSRLTVPERFERDARTVSLAGHAYFEVAPDAARPFLVQTPGAVVRVLGTAFDLRAHPGGGARLVVRSGRVSIRAAAVPAAVERVVVPGERATVEADGAVQVERGVDIEDALAWTSGRLVFERAPLSEVVEEIERWRDVRIDVADEELGRRRLTASFEHEPLDAVLETISELVNARVGVDTARYILTPRADPKP